MIIHKVTSLQIKYKIIKEYIIEVRQKKRGSLFISNKRKNYILCINL